MYLDITFKLTLESIGIAYMSGFSHIFDECKAKYDSTDDKLALFRAFRTRKGVYWFIDNGDVPPNQEYVEKAKAVSSLLYTEYVNGLQGRKLIGYDEYPSPPVHAAYNDLDSRHILMSTLLFSHVKEPVGNVLEIGGGYANFMYLNRNKQFQNWTIVDLDYVCQLQSWCLQELEVDPSKYQIVATEQFHAIKDTSYDIVIGTHSLSEISAISFLEYFTSTIQHAKYLLYSHNRDLPDRGLLEFKRQTIEQSFDLVEEIITDGGICRHCLFKNKKEAK